MSKKPIEKKVVRDGIIKSVSYTINFDAEEEPDIWEVMKLPPWRSTEDEIKALKETLERRAPKSNRRYAQDAAEAFGRALAALEKITDPGEKKRALDVAADLIRAFQSVWRADVKRIEPVIVTGVRIRNGGDSGRANRKKTPAHAEWQKEADKLFKNNSSLSKNDAGRSIVKKLKRRYPEQRKYPAFRTIANIITKK